MIILDGHSQWHMYVTCNRFPKYICTDMVNIHKKSCCLTKGQILLLDVHSFLCTDVSGQQVSEEEQTLAHSISRVGNIYPSFCFKKFKKV